VHRELDRLARPGAAPFAATSQSLRSRLAVELAELGVPRERIGVATERVAEAIQRTLSERRGRWLLGLDGDLEAAESELALSGVIDGAVVAHVIDRTFVDASGTRWVVDFKTSAHEGGGLDEFLASEVTRYRGQLARYARLMRGYRPDEPVRAALYFPLLGAWQEVEV
jgi:ATP-dependent helicase/nuclease subunit A